MTHISQDKQIGPLVIMLQCITLTKIVWVLFIIAVERIRVDLLSTLVLCPITAFHIFFASICRHGRSR